MIVMRQLTNKEIEKLANRKNVKAIAVYNFLGTLDESIGYTGNGYNLICDARSYKWNSATQTAIRKGIEMAFKE